MECPPRPQKKGLELLKVRRRQLCLDGWPLGGFGDAATVCWRQNGSTHLYVCLHGILRNPIMAPPIADADVCAVACSLDLDRSCCKQVP
ncbi:hypothetical protein PMIN01_06492 [Paraphaeosphaeria minitans]|uniref:Uncharacterized protein n=1 Tax=Paraphaeosphaeria minitans TaxID=565426 RepID=A0A9P6GGA5_9PLEO|nr:hypothetical protein PMIN01_06492 [Paraphaeosphaeria minitans]